MIKQIKIFTEPSYKKLEENVNKWTKENDNQYGIRVINIVPVDKHNIHVIYEK